MDLSGRLLVEPELEQFAEEFCKHEELLKPRTNNDSPARREALQKLGAAFNIPDSKEMTRQLTRFRLMCISKMRWLIRVAQARYGTGADALLIAPAWLRRLDRTFCLMINALKMERAPDAPPSALGVRTTRFTWELYCAVRDELRDAPDPAALVLDAAVVAPFAARARLPTDTVHGIWTRMYAAALTKLRHSSQLGDLKNPSRPTTLQWHVIDLALLYDPQQMTLAKQSFTHAMEIEAMLQLYKLITEAHNKLGKDKQNTTETRQKTTENNQHVPGFWVFPLAGSTDQPPIAQNEFGAGTGTTTNSGNSQAAGPSGSGARESVEDRYPLLKSCLEHPPEWESAEIWTMVHSEYNKRGRVASLVTLQRRWYELRLLARRGLLLSFRDHTQKPHPLLLAIVKRFPHVVTSPLPLWPQLVRNGRVHTHDALAETQIEASLNDVPSTVSMSDVMTDLLDWSDDEPEIIEPYKEVIEIDSDDETDANPAKTQTPMLATVKTEPRDDANTKLLQYYTDIIQENTDHTTQTGNPRDNKTNITKSEQFNDLNKKLISDIEQDISLNTSVVKSEEIDISDTTVQERSRTTEYVENTQESNAQKARSRIMFEDDEDLNEIENFFANLDDFSSNYDPIDENINEMTSDDKHVTIKSESIKTDASSTHRAASKLNKELSRSALKQKVVDNYYKKVPHDCFKDIASGNTKVTDEQNSDNDSDSDGEKCSEDESICDGGIDEKLLMLSRVVLTPVEHIAEWRRHGRGASVNCRAFSVRRFAAPVLVTPRQLNACRRYVPARQASAGAPAERAAAGASGTGIAREKSEELRRIPRAYKVMRRQLTARLRLPRTLLSRGFWTNARNVAQLCVCDPLAVALERRALRPVKKVELADIEEVRRINSTILTAQVAPISVEAPTDAESPESTGSDAAGGLTRSPESQRAADAEAGAAELPSQEDLMKMIKTLVHPSIKAMREAEARLRARRAGDGARPEREEALLQRQRDSSRRLNHDILRLVSGGDHTHQKSREREVVIRRGKLKPKEGITEDEQPLPDAYEEWHRQKTLVHKYFNLNTPAHKTNARKHNKRTQNEPSDKQTKRSVPKVNDKIDPNNKIDLMTVSDDDDAAPAGGGAASPHVDTNDTKRPHSDDSDNSNKRVKLNRDHPNDEVVKCKEENIGSDDDGDRMFIDEGIHDIDDPTGTNDQLSTAGSQQTPPNNPLLTIMPVSSVPGLHSEHDMPSNVVYIVKTHTKVPKNADVIPTSSTVSSIKLPGDTSLTRNTPVTMALNTKLPTYYFIQSGKQIRGNSEFKGHSGPPLQSILPKPPPTPTTRIQNQNFINTSEVHSAPPLQAVLPKSAPTARTPTVINTSESIQTPAQHKFTHPTNIIKLTRPGPLSSKPKLNSNQILKLSVPVQINKTNEETPQPKIIEEIDLTDDTEESNATGEGVRPQIVLANTLTQIKKEKDVANPNSNNDVNMSDKIIDSTKLPVKPVSKGTTLALEVGPIDTAANTYTWPDSNTRILTLTPGSSANNNTPSVNVTFILNKQTKLTAHKNKDVADDKTIRSDSAASVKKPSVECALIKKERDLDIDSSSNDSESRDVDVESVADEPRPSIDEVTPVVEKERGSPLKSNVPATDNNLGNKTIRTYEKRTRKTTSQNEDERRSLLKMISQNVNITLLKKNTQKEDPCGSLLKTSSQKQYTNKNLYKTTTQNEDSTRSRLKTTSQSEDTSSQRNQQPTETCQPKDTDNIPVKITSTTTSKDLLKLSPEELARLLEDDNEYEEVVEYAQTPQEPAAQAPAQLAEQNTAPAQVAKQNTAPAQTKLQNIAPIQIKKEKLWTQELEQSKGRDKISTEGVVVKQEPGGSGGTESEKESPVTNLELLLDGVPAVSELKTALPDVICGDVMPVDDEEVTPYFQSIIDLGKKQINIKDYVGKVTDPEEPILKLDFSEPIWILAEKYVLLTDENIEYAHPAYVTCAPTQNIAPYTLIQFPEHVRNKQTLNLGIKKGRDVMVCGCGGKGTCMLCQSIAGEGGKAPEFEIYKPTFNKLCRACGVDPQRERARIYTIKQRPYRKIGDTPLKFVVIDVRKKCKVCKDGAQFVAAPDTLVINDKYYEKMRDTPLMYAPVLSVVQGAARCARFARREAELYLLNLRTARRRRVLYRADAHFGAFNAAVRAAVAKMDREEVDAWYRRKCDKENSS